MKTFSVDTLINLAISRYATLPHGAEFTLSDLLPELWPDLPLSVRMTLGKVFFRRTLAETAIEIRPKDVKGRQTYRRP